MASKQMAEYELVPPDGGWGWMVVIGAALNYITGQSQVSVFSLVFGNKLISMGHETTSAAMIMNIANAVFSFSGLFIGPLMKKFSTRQVAFVGGVSLATGLMLSSFADSLIHIVITYGVLVGLGLNLVLSSTFLAVKAYFVASRGRALGLAMAGVTCGQMAMPHLVRLLLETYGFSGTLLLLGALALHGPAGSLLIHPLEWHAERRPVVCEMQPLEDSSRDECEKSGRQLMGDSDTRQQKPQSYWRRVVVVMDLDLLTSGRYLNVAVATASVTMANVNFSMLLPLLLQNHAGLSMSDTALCLTMTAAGDLVARLVVPPVVDRVKMSPRLAYLLGVVVLAVTRSALAASSRLAATLAWAWLCGAGSGVVTVYSNLSIAEVAAEHKLPAAVGLNMLFNGLLSLSLGPLLGYIRDETKNFPICIHILSALICATMVSWCLEWAVRRYRNKRSLTDT